MIILRQPPYPIEISYDVPEANTDYIMVFDDNVDYSEIVVNVTSTSQSKVVYTLTGNFTKYDQSWPVTIYIDEDGERGEVVVQDNLDISRPYVNPNTLGTTASEIAEWTEYESLARAMIDVVTGGIYYERDNLEVDGNGTDYITLWHWTHKILKVYENAELVYDATQDPIYKKDYDFIITKDGTAVTKDFLTAVDSYNRSESRPRNVQVGLSDSIGFIEQWDSPNIAVIRKGVFFPDGVDYIFVTEKGYKVVPIDIQDATKMLMNDIKCGKLDYYTRFVNKYQTDQFTIEFNPAQFEGTGNILVDKILLKYVRSIARPGVL